MGILATVAVYSITATAVLTPQTEASVGSLVSFSQAVHSVSAAQYYQFINVEAVQVNGPRWFDSITVGDTLSKTVGKTFADSVTVTDTLVSLDETELLADSASATDVFSRVFDAQREFNETVTATDAYANALEKPFADSVTAADAFSQSITNPLLNGDILHGRVFNG